MFVPEMPDDVGMIFVLARAVLEINGGLAARLGIRPGDRVRHAFFD